MTEVVRSAGADGASRTGWGESSCTEPPPPTQDGCPLEPPLLPEGSSEEARCGQCKRTEQELAAALKRSREGTLVWGLQPGQGRAQAQGPRRVAFSIVSVCSGQEPVRPSPALASREVGTAAPAWATSGSPGSLNVKRGVNYK